MLDNIKRKCNDRGISINQLEREIDVSENSIYRWDKVSPAVEKVRRVAEFFGCTVDELLREEKEE